MSGRLTMKLILPFILLSAVASASNAATTQSGLCSSGAPFTLTHTEVEVSGVKRPYFIYEGPQGRGEVQSSVNLPSALAYVCSTPQEQRWLDDEQRDD